MSWRGKLLGFLVVLGCAHVDRQAVLREAVIAADDTFTVWYTDATERAETAEEFEKLRALRQHWEDLLLALRRIDAPEGEMDAARRAARDFFDAIGLEPPEGM